MLVFWEERLVVLATPKTGSTAIETALESIATLAVPRPPQLKHTGVHRYRKLLAPYLESAAGAPFTVVALMREPISWLGSWYRYRQRDAVSGTARSTRGLSFDDYVQAYLSPEPPEHAAVGSQHRFLVPEKSPPADRIFRYETIESFVDFLEERLDFEIVLPRLNVSPEAAMVLSAETEARLRTALDADFALYESLSD
ncbi:MAG: hypothetical protein R3D84_17090 [Paracoccaceae bacterium]